MHDLVSISIPDSFARWHHMLAGSSRGKVAADMHSAGRKTEPAAEDPRAATGDLDSSSICG